MRVFLAIVAMLFFASSVTAEDMSTVNYSTDNKLLSEVKTRMILENGLVIHIWEWNEIGCLSLSINFLTFVG